MKKSKVENISEVKLEFFVKQNKEDVRVILKSGEFSWYDQGTTTKSMILYERKGLIKSTEHSDITIVDEDAANINNDEILDHLHTTEDIEYIKVMGVDPPDFTPDTTVGIDIVPVQAMAEPDKEFFMELVCDTLTPLEKAKKETEEYKKESEKTYKGKKRGRKKKRGPKTGSKRKKGGDSPSTEI